MLRFYETFSLSSQFSFFDIILSLVLLKISSQVFRSRSGKIEYRIVLYIGQGGWALEIKVRFLSIDLGIGITGRCWYVQDFKEL
jgi:hypothetical protein